MNEKERVHRTRESIQKGKTPDLVLTSSDQLLFTLKISFFLFYKMSYLNEEVNRKKPSPSVRVPVVI
jgi:hypothetical protein